MNIQKLFRDFTSVMKSQSGILTEDNLRYFFFAKMYDQDSELKHYTLELPYSKMGRDVYPALSKTATLKGDNGSGEQELDMFYSDGKECICMEFKFHRRGLTDSDFPHADAAGSLFNDMKRLQLIKGSVKGIPVRKLFLYATDAEMDEYLDYGDKTPAKNDYYRKILKDFYTMPAGESTSIDFSNISEPTTFVAASNKSFKGKPKTVIDIMLLDQCSFESESQSIMKDKERKRSCFIKLFEVL